MSGPARGTVTIDIEACKGCDLCIAACPPRVLEMSTAVNQAGYHYPRLLPGCTGCSACMQVCPDFVFEIYRFRDAPAARQGGTPKEARP